MSAAPEGEGNQTGRFSAEERAAMKERAAELKAEAPSRQRRGKGGGRRGCCAGEDRRDATARSRHGSSVCTRSSPMPPQSLRPKLYYGQPGWAEGGKVIVFFRSGLMDKARYSTLGFSVSANLDAKGGLWPTSYALEQLTDDSAKTIAKLVKKAVG